MQKDVNYLNKFRCTLGWAVGLLFLFAQCRQENSQWENLSLTINGEDVWVQGVNFLGAPHPESTYYLKDGNLTVKIEGNTIDYGDLVWRVNKEVHPVLGSEKYLSIEDLAADKINTVAICLGKKGPCKSIFISLDEQPSVFDDEFAWDEQIEEEEIFLDEPIPNTKPTPAIKTTAKENTPVVPALEVISSSAQAEVEREYYQNGRTGYSEKQRCPNGDQYTLERTLKITLVPSTFLELKSFKLISTDNGKIDVLIQGEAGEKWRINGRAMVGGSASEINLESLTCELRPDVRYTITVSAAPNMEFENLQGCQDWSGGNEHLSLFDAGQGGAFFDIRYKY